MVKHKSYNKSTVEEKEAKIHYNILTNRKIQILKLKIVEEDRSVKNKFIGFRGLGCRHCLGTTKTKSSAKSRWKIHLAHLLIENDKK